jgi:hypothetical protein
LLILIDFLIFKILMANVSFPVVSASPFLELITANVLTVANQFGVVSQSATGSQIVAGTAYVSLNGGTLPRFRRRALLSDDLVASRALLQTVDLPLLTGDCNGDGFFNAYDATYLQDLVNNGANLWPVTSLVQMRNCAPSYSYMFNAVQSSYSALDIQLTSSDVAYLLSASTNKLFS